MNEQKSFPIEVKSLNDVGEFSGYLSVFNEVDSYKDVVCPGAFARSIKSIDSGRKLPILWMHDTSEPIGIWTKLVEDNHGLYVEGKLAIDTEEGARAYSLLKLGALSGLSIGYQVKQKEIKNGIRYLKEIKLLEGSIVTFPACDDARVEDVKADEDTTMTDEQKAAAEAEQKAKATSKYAQALSDISDYRDKYHEQDKRASALIMALYDIRKDPNTSLDDKKKAMRAVRHEHADSMADLDEAQMDREAAKKAAEDKELETKSAEEKSELEAKKKLDNKTKAMHKLMMAKAFHQNGIKAHNAAMECMKDMDFTEYDASDVGGGSDTGTMSFNGAISLAEVSETTETKEAAQEDPDLLHSVRDGLKSLSLTDDDSEVKFDLHSLSGMAGLLD